MNESKSNYVEARMGVFREKYDIPITEEFNLNLLFETEYEIRETDSKHTKTKMDLVKIYQDLQRNAFKNLKIKNKYEKTEKRKIILLLDHTHQVQEFGNILKTFADYSDNIESYKDRKSEFVIETKNVSLTLLTNKKDIVRGKRAEVFYNLEDVTREFMN